MTTASPTARQELRVVLLDRSTQNPFSRGLARALERAGVDATIAGPYGDVDREVVPVFPAGVPGAKPRKLAQAATGFWRYIGLLARLRPAVVHVQWPGAVNAAFALIAERAFSARVVYTEHNPAPRLGDRPARGRRYLLRRSTAVVTLSDRAADIVRTRHPDCADKVHVIRHGNYDHVITRFERADARRALSIPPDCVTYTFVGQIRRRKGLEQLLEAAGRVQAEFYDITLVVAGQAVDDAYVDELRRLADRLELSPRWHVTPEALDQTTIDLAVAAADQVVLPFRSAALSGSLVLAMSHGACVVSTDVGDTRELLAGRGLLVPPADPRALAEAMGRAITDPDSCRALGRAALTYAHKELDWAHAANVLRPVYERVSEGVRSPSSGPGPRDPETDAASDRSGR